MRWALSHCCAPRARRLADRHYPRQRSGAVRFVAPGSPLVLLTPAGDALWVTLRQRPEYVDHAWPGAWSCTLFRNEGPHLSSELIMEALAATRAQWGEPPPEGLITFVDPEATRRRRSRRAAPGACFRHAGFREVGMTSERGRMVLHLPPEAFPPAAAPLGAQLGMWARGAA